METWKLLSKKHIMGAYCTILFLVTLLLAPVDLLLSQAEVDVLSIYFMQLSPGITAIVLVLINREKDGMSVLFDKLLRWRVRPSLYFLSVFAAVWMALSNVLLTGIQLNSIAFSAVVGIVIGCIGEEIGWRGFLLPHLLEKNGALKSSLLVGIIWEIWHFPLRFVILYQGDVALFLVMYVLMAAATIAFSFLLTSIYNHAGGSILPSILIHAIYNILLVYLTPLHTDLMQIVTFSFGTVLLSLVVVRFMGLSERR